MARHDTYYGATMNQQTKSENRMNVRCARKCALNAHTRTRTLEKQRIHFRAQQDAIVTMMKFMSHRTNKTRIMHGKMWMAEAHNGETLRYASICVHLVLWS